MPNQKPTLDYARPEAKPWYAYRRWQGMILAVLVAVLIALWALIVRG